MPLSFLIKDITENTINLYDDDVSNYFNNYEYRKFIDDYVKIYNFKINVYVNRTKEINIRGTIYNVKIYKCEDIISIINEGVINCIQSQFENIKIFEKLMIIYNKNTIYKLNLKKCNKLNNINNQGIIYYLNLVSCKYISSINNVGKICELHLYHCKNIIDIGTLNDIKNFISNNSYYGLHLLKKLNGYRNEHKKININGFKKLIKFQKISNTDICNILNQNIINY